MTAGQLMGLLRGLASLMTGNVDAAVVPYSFADMAKRAGARALADAGRLKLIYQATGMCAPKDSASINQEIMIP